MIFLNDNWVVSQLSTIWEKILHIFDKYVRGWPQTLFLILKKCDVTTKICN